MTVGLYRVAAIDKIAVAVHGPLDSLAHGRKTEPARCDSVYELRPVTSAAASATATASILPYSSLVLTAVEREYLKLLLCCVYCM